VETRKLTEKKRNVYSTWTFWLEILKTFIFWGFWIISWKSKWLNFLPALYRYRQIKVLIWVNYRMCKKIFNPYRCGWYVSSHRPEVSQVWKIESKTFIHQFYNQSINQIIIKLSVITFYRWSIVSSFLPKSFSAIYLLFKNVYFFSMQHYYYYFFQ
jgi:hypothetical protein